MPQSKSSNHSSSRRSRRDYKAKQASTARKSLRFGKLSEQFRRWKKRQERSGVEFAEQLAEARKNLEFRGIKRQLRKTRFPTLNIARFLRPAAGIPIPTRDALSALLRAATFALLQLTLISIVFSSIPAKPTKPEWYLQVLSLIAETGPVYILAFGLGALALFVAPADPALPKFRKRLIGLSHKLYIFLALLLPVQAAFTFWLFSQAYGQERIQLNAVKTESNAIIAGAKQQTSTESFINYLQSRGVTADLNAIRSNPLDRVKDELITMLQSQQTEVQQRIRNETRKNTLRYVLQTFKLFISLVILAGFARLLFGILKRSFLQKTASSKIIITP
jgi:hypothetical protein